MKFASFRPLTGIYIFKPVNGKEIETGIMVSVPLRGSTYSNLREICRKDL